MNKHEKFKKICDKIGYKRINIKDGFLYKITGMGYIYTEINDVGEIIFTQEFIDKLIIFIKNGNSYGYSDSWQNLLLNNLNNPVDYLYNLIK